MSSNRVTLDGLRRLTVAEVAHLPIEQLAALQEDVAALKADASACDERLRDALAVRFGAFADKSRRVLGKDTGTVRWDEDGYTVVADLPKAVVWDQAKLKRAEEEIRMWGENPAEFITIKRGVAEAKYAAWPSSIREVFDTARTVKAGKPSFELLRKDAA